MGTRIDIPRDGCVRHRSSAAFGASLAAVVCFGCGIGAGIANVVAAGADGSKPDQKVLAQGRELFEREWLPGDSRSHGGDGLGPVFNDSSCVVCHNLGGSGGGGPASKNVDIITASPNGQVVIQMAAPPQAIQVEPGFLAKALGSLVGIDTGGSPERAQAATTTSAVAQAPARQVARRKIDTGPLIAAHPGFRTSRSVVLHRFGTEDKYESWRQGLLGFNGGLLSQTAQNVNSQFRAMNGVNFERNSVQNLIGEFVVVRSQRNPTALFGAGLLDSIPEAVIEQAAKAKYPEFPTVAGRISRLKDKRIGRFGWKAQTASLPDFVLTACAVELGLEVPGHHQGGSPQKPDVKATGLDLAAEECNALVSYIRELPRPAELLPATDQAAREIAVGRSLFGMIGCATCHTPKLGDVGGIYSDLLLHDLGPQLGDTGQYGVFDPGSSEEEIVDPVQPIADASTDLPRRIVVGTLPGLPPPVPSRPPAADTVAVTVAPQAVVPAPAAPPQGEPTSTALPLAPPGPVPPFAIAPQADAGLVAVVPDQASFAMSPMPMMPGAPSPAKRPTSGPASRFEWRTPPLWGFRDTGPYLHDGRAETLDQTVALHGGEAAMISARFFALEFKERRQVEAFLKSLTAPPPSELLARAAN